MDRVRRRLAKYSSTSSRALLTSREALARIRIVKGDVHRIATASLQIAALIVFSAAAPLAHLHQGQDQGQRGRDHFDDHKRHGALPSHHGITFHAHVDGHPHGSNQESPEYPSSGGESHDDSLNLSHGRMDSTRIELPASPHLAVTPTVELRPPSTASPGLAGAGFDVYRPPPLLFRKPVRAPPSSC